LKKKQKKIHWIQRERNYYCEHSRKER